MDEPQLLIIFQTRCRAFDDYTRLVEADQQLEEDEASWVTDKLKSQQVFINQQFEIPLKDALKLTSTPKFSWRFFRREWETFALIN